VTVLEYLKGWPWLHSVEGDKLHRPSSSEIRRWCEKGSVIINGVKVKSTDQIKFPIRQLILHPESKNRITIFNEQEEQEEEQERAKEAQQEG